MGIWNVLAVAMPGLLFVSSVAMVTRHVKKNPSFSALEMAWLSIPLLVNVLSTLWLSKVLSVMTPSLEMPAVYLQTTEKVGLALFISMVFALSFRSLIAAIAGAFKKTKQFIMSLFKRIFPGKSV